MEKINKTFEMLFNTYIINGIISTINDQEISNIENVDIEKYSECIFNLSLTAHPAVDIEIFNCEITKLFILSYNGTEGKLGFLKEKKFIPIEEKNDLVNNTRKSTGSFNTQS